MAIFNSQPTQFLKIKQSACKQAPAAQPHLWA